MYIHTSSLQIYRYTNAFGLLSSFFMVTKVEVVSNCAEGWDELIITINISSFSKICSSVIEILVHKLLSLSVNSNVTFIAEKSSGAKKLTSQ